MRLTGGEPLVRKGVVDARRPALRARVRRPRDDDQRDGAGRAWPRQLAAAGLRRVNISCDSLRPERFAPSGGGATSTTSSRHGRGRGGRTRPAQGQRRPPARAERRRDPRLRRLCTRDGTDRAVHRVHAARRPGRAGTAVGSSRAGEVFDGSRALAARAGDPSRRAPLRPSGSASSTGAGRSGSSRASPSPSAGPATVSA